MPCVRFTRNIQRHMECPEREVSGGTVRAVLDSYFALHLRARSDVLDDLNHLRRHMAVFIDGNQVMDRDGLSDVTAANSVLDVIQALSAQRRPVGHLEPRPLRVKLHRSRDGGVTWMEMAAPKYPAKPEGYVPKVPVEGKAAEWSLQLIWALTLAGTDQPGVIWCGTLPGGLFRSGDGETWQLNRPLWDNPRREEWLDRRAHV